MVNLTSISKVGILEHKNIMRVMSTFEKTRGLDHLFDGGARLPFHVRPHTLVCAQINLVQIPQYPVNFLSREFFDAFRYILNVFATRSLGGAAPVP